MLYDIGYMWNLKKAELIKTEENGGYQGLEMGELGRCCLMVQACN